MIIVLDLNDEQYLCLMNEKRQVLLDFSLTVKAAPHECVVRTSQP